jgi:predicted dehydrogenase/threonine dehydrogenase-like Zn-dependent dehydrogenase
MRQLFVQNGQVVIQNVPAPALDVRGILVETRAATISVGTETRELGEEAEQSLLGKLIRSADLRRKAIRLLKEGKLWSAVWQQLGRGAPTSPPRAFLGVPTGYSCAGCVLEVSEQISDVQVGDRVACAGSSHAEIVYAPQNLFVPVPQGVSDAEAAFVALGSIALHSVRQARLTCGETAVVMGLGVIGQLVEQLARAAGARTIVADLVRGRREMARQLGAHLVLDPTADDLEGQVIAFSDGYGADAVILCVGGDSPEPIEQALRLVRDRGRLVVVGTPRMDIPRSLFYRKEVELYIARSYGPGRYDPEYEEEGRDYPIGYVRWTERRNMAEFLRLVSEQRVKVSPLITHRFAFEQAPQAYQAAVSDSETTLGIVLTREAEPALVAAPAKPAKSLRRLGIAVAGAGSFARATHLAHIAQNPDLRLRAIVTNHKSTAEQAAVEFKAEAAATDIDVVLKDPAVELVILATPHHLHAKQSIAALEAGKAVFCEKPMGLSRSEVEEVCEAVRRTKGFYAIGFNRRFAPAVRRAKDLLAGRKGPMVLNYRVMTTFTSADHRIYHPKLGGGPIVGEACHFFDLLCYLVGSAPAQLRAVGGALSHPGTRLDDNVICTMTFPDGSIASLVYGDLGDKQFPKERIEIFVGEGVLVIDDFRELGVAGFSRQRGMRLPRVDKGWRAELEAAVAAVIEGTPSPVSAEDGRRAMECAFQVVETLRGKR